MKKLIKSLLPPLIANYIQKKRNQIWHGNYSSWIEARTKSQGYDSEEILNKVILATRNVVNGVNKYERDSVNFDSIEYSWPVVTSLLWILNNEKKLNVLDFGGALGSSYRQNKKFMNFENIKWNIVEQKSFVDAGRKEFQNEILNFYYDIDTCISSNDINLIFISSTLQYIEKPYEILNKLISLNIKYIVLDRISIIDHIEDRLTIQNVPESIYKASYPCWFFSENNILSLFDQNYEKVESFTSYLPNYLEFEDGKKSTDKGYIFRLKH